tara:strand:- start:9749 stop:10420 length:672 start_codon:yes stop_codon:yes gene_type:complete
MISLTSNTLGEIWLSSIQSVLEQGQPHFDEDVGIREVIGLSIEVASPSPEDKFIYSVGDPKVIAKMLRKFSKGVVMEDRPFTYGQLIYDMNGVDQFEWMVDRLRRKPETKSASISLLRPGSNDFNLPCLSVLDAKIRLGALHLQFFFRSQNIFGRQYANLLALAELHKALACRLNCGVGGMKGLIASAHIYDYDLESAHSLVETLSTKVTDQYYSLGPASIRK